MYCYRCSQPASHITKKGLQVCDKNPAKCPACSTKGRPQKPKIQPEVYNGDQLCQYGCHAVAKFKFQNGKYCCTANSANCSFIRKEAGKKIQQSKFVEVLPGVTLGQLASRKAAEKKLSDVDENGLNAHIRSAQKVAAIKKENIDRETGLNAHQINGQKYQQWLKSEDGKIWRENMRQRTRQAMTEIDPVTGQKEANKRAAKMVETKSSNVDALGLNGFERAHWKSNLKNSGFIDGIFWQYANERRFLERAKALGIIKSFSRGPRIPYTVRGVSKTFFADFLIDNKIFEVKSRYTLFGPKNQFLEKNIAKLFAAQRAGYDIYLVVDDETMSFKDFLGTISNLLE